MDPASDFTRIPLLARRGRVAVFGVLGFFLLLAGRLFSLQVVQHEALAERLADQSADTVTLKAERGAILARDGSTALAVTRMEAYSVYANPRAISDFAATARRLAGALGLSEPAVLATLVAHRDKYFCWVKRRVTRQEEEAVDALEMRGVGVLRDARREYPYGDFATHLLGFVGNDGAGLDGLELKFNAHLRGEAGERTFGRDAAGRRIFDPDYPGRDAVPGGSLVLALDAYVQSVVEEELNRLCEEWNPVSATILAMDPRTGGVLAMANRPSFDPNRFGAATAEQRRNHAIADQYEMGSIFKPLTIVGAVDAGAARMTDLYNCSGGAWSYSGRRITDVHGYGSLCVTDIIVKSSNIGTAKIIVHWDEQSHGSRPLIQLLTERYGFGRPTGIDLPGEGRGLLPNLRGWKTSQESISVSFGHGISVTPAQVLAGMNAIANGGLWHVPYVVAEMRSPGGETVARHAVEGRRILKSEACAGVREAMRQVVLRGTGKKADIKVYAVAGKTGTAEKVVNGGYAKDKNVSSFICFAPAEDPVLSLLVVADEVRQRPDGLKPYGGNVSAPVAGRIMLRALTWLGVAREREGQPAAGREGSPPVPPQAGD
ncbi:MAG: penicillin-binding protein 2 [Planctomycetes bacterium]|nr:penicillin-binding protein 2 [Planctomycetota bacterium]